MKLYGFALLPDVRTQQRIIDFQQRHLDSVGSPMLGLQQNLPHTSLLQHPYQPDADYERFLDAADERLETTWTRFFYQPAGWLFAGVAKTAQLQALHNRLFELTRDLIDVSQINQERDLSGMTPEEQRNYRAYGYRYVGDLFKPHVTIGRTRDGLAAADERTAEDFEREFAGASLVYDRIVFYEAGEFGALKRVVCLRELG